MSDTEKNKEESLTSSEKLDTAKDNNLSKSELETETSAEITETSGEAASEKMEEPAEPEPVQEDVMSNSEEVESANPDTDISKPVSEQNAEPVNEDVETAMAEKPPIKLGESNYQISLINENLLRIRVVTEKSVEVDCFVKDKSTRSQSNKILVHPKTDGKAHEIEIVVSINSSTGALEVQQSPVEQESGEEDSPGQTIRPDQNSNGLQSVVTSPFQKVKKFLIDPDVADLVKKQTDIDSAYKPRSRTEIYEERLGPKNRYKLNRELILKNFKRGIVGSLIVFVFFSIVIFSAVAKKSSEENEPKPERQIVIEDLPEMKVDVPFNEKQKEEEDNSDSKNTVTLPQTKPPKVKKYVAPKISSKIDSNKTDTTKNLSQNENNKLDSLRKGTNNGSVTNVPGIPDSLFKPVKFDEKSELPIIMPMGYYGWGVDMEASEKTSKITGEKSAIVTDTFSVGKDADRVPYYMSIVNADGTNKFPSLKPFEMNDKDIKAFSSEPDKKKGDENIIYAFILKKAPDVVTVTAVIKSKFFDQYKPKIEEAVKNIKFKAPPEKPVNDK